jgi:transcriptional regulator GlxA family with amidase domain
MPEVTAATLYGFYDALSSAGRDWQLLHGREPGALRFRPLVVSHDGQPFVGANGVRITPDTGFADCPPPAVVCITDIAVMPGQPLDARYDAAVAWLRERHPPAPCRLRVLGAVLLARTGCCTPDATSN